MIATSGAPCKRAKRLPWRSVPPQTGVERLAFAADLEAFLADPSHDYAEVRRTFTAALLGLSGAELHDLGLLIVQQLRTSGGLA